MNNKSRNRIRNNEKLNHLKVKKYGDSLILFSQSEKHKENHARLTSLGSNQWGLSLPRHTGGWEKTPFTDTIDELMNTLLENFYFYLEPYK